MEKEGEKEKRLYTHWTGKARGGLLMTGGCVILPAGLGEEGRRRSPGYLILNKHESFLRLRVISCGETGGHDRTVGKLGGVGGTGLT